MISKRYRNRAMRIYTDYFNKSPRGKTVLPKYLYEAGFPRKVDALETTRVLASMGYLALGHFHYEGDYVEKLTDKGKCYFEVSSDQRRLRWFDRLCGFVSGVAVTVLSGVIVYLITS